MSVQEQLAQAQAKIAAMEAELKARDSSNLTMTISAAGYVNVAGLKGASWKGLGASPDAWIALAEHMPRVVAFAKANRDECAKRYKAYQAANGKAVG